MQHVKLSLTVTQAVALWQLAEEGWSAKAIQDADREKLSPVDLRAMAALEDAIEKVRGQLAHRVTVRTQ